MSQPGPSESPAPSEALLPSRRLLRDQRSAASARPKRQRAEDGRPPRKRGMAKRMVAKLTSAGAMLGAAALLIATSVPANAFMQPVEFGAAATTAAAAPAQQLQVARDVTADGPARDAYTVETLAQQLKAKFLSTDWSYAPNPTGAVRWPFPVAVPITSGFGPRLVAGCGFCTTYHYGIDFVPGVGAPIGAIADGVVSEAGATGAFGNHVIIDHVINGQKVQSLYAHMLTGSVTVTTGQQVHVGDIIGQVGATGDATGPHLHLEIHLDGTPVDPFPWLKANTA